MRPRYSGRTAASDVTERNYSYITVFIAALLCLLLLAACTSPTPETTGPARHPQRIVSLGPASTEILFAAGCGPRVILRDAFSLNPPEALKIPAAPEVFPSAEYIASLAPDLAVLSFPPGGYADALVRTGMKVVSLAPALLEDIPRNLEETGAACGETERAKLEATRRRGELAALRAGLKNVRRPTAYIEMDYSVPRKPFTVGRGAFLFDAAVEAGTAPVFPAAGGWIQISDEQVLAADPEVILLADCATPQNPQTPEGVAARPGWSSLKAVRNGRVICLAPFIDGSPGPRIIEGAARLARALHPEAAP